MENDAIFIDDIELLFVMLFRFADAEFLEIYELPSDGVDLFAQISAELAYEKSGFPVSGGVLDKKLLKKFRSAVGSEEFR